MRAVVVFAALGVMVACDSRQMSREPQPTPPCAPVRARPSLNPTPEPPLCRPTTSSEVVAKPRTPSVPPKTADVLTGKTGADLLKAALDSDRLTQAQIDALATPAPPVKTPPRQKVWIDPMDWLSVPRRIAPDELARRADALSAKVKTARFEVPARPALGAPTVRPDAPGEVWAWDDVHEVAFKKEPAEVGARGTPVRFYRRLLSHRPAATLMDKGMLTVRFSTVRPIQSATLSVGEVLRDDVIWYPRLRKSTHKLIEVPGGDGVPKHTYELAYSLPSLHKWRYRTKGPQHDVAWRLEVLDEVEGNTRVRDGRLSVTCDPGPCGKVDEKRTPLATYHRLPTLFVNPVVDQVTSRSAIVSFDTDVPVVATVLVTDGKRINAFERAQSSTHHEVLVDGLDEQTRYRYAVLISDGAGRVATWPGATFKTAPKPGASTPVRIAVMSDSRSGKGTSDENYCNVNRRVLEGLLSNALRRGAEAIVFVGDLVDGYTTEPSDFAFQLEAWQQVASPFGAYVPIYEAIGNHEAVLTVDSAGWAGPAPGDDSAESIFARHVVNPSNGPSHPDPIAPTFDENTYSFDHGNVHFAIVNSNYWLRSHPDRKDHPMGEKGYREGIVDPAALEWLEKDLEAARARGQVHLLVGTHEPVFPNGGHPKDGMWWFGKVEKVNAMRNRFLSILSKHKVAAVLHGDEHNYSRLIIRKGDAEPFAPVDNPITQIITGGAGAPWYVQQMDLPWSNEVEWFDIRQHVVLLDADGPNLRGTVVALSGETIESFAITPAPR